MIRGKVKMGFEFKDYDYKEDAKWFPFIKEDISDEGFFSGYGSTFGGKPDSYNDLIKYGAFTETIIKGGKFRLGVKALAEHKNTIGIYTELSENQRGLKVKGQIEIKTTIGGDTFLLMKMGAINALSIGWEPLREDSKGKRIPIEEAIEWDDKLNIRTLKLIDLWEISPVTFPANDRAVITDVKSAIENASTPTQMERALRDAGLSRSVAKYITSLCKHSLMNERTYYDQDLKVMLGKLKNVNDELALGGILNSLRTFEIPTVQCDAGTKDK
jgi:hypothetical protein